MLARLTSTINRRNRCLWCHFLLVPHIIRLPLPVPLMARGRARGRLRRPAPMAKQLPPTRIFRYHSHTNTPSLTRRCRIPCLSLRPMLAASSPPIQCTPPLTVMVRARREVRQAPIQALMPGVRARRQRGPGAAHCQCWLACSLYWSSSCSWRALS